VTGRDEEILFEQTVLALAAAEQAKLTVDTALLAHGIPATELELLLRLPPVVELAVADYQAALCRLAMLLAAGAGQAWAPLPTGLKQQYLRAAFAALIGTGGGDDKGRAAAP
jgi:hypothetical protein